MDTIFINTESSKTSKPNRFRLYFIYKLDLRRNKTISLVNLLIYYTCENINSKYNNNKFKISGPTWSETFDLPDGSYEIPNIQDYFLKMIQKHKPTIEIRKNIFACLFSVHNTISLSRHEQVCLMRQVLAHDVINLLYYNNRK